MSLADPIADIRDRQVGVAKRTTGSMRPKLATQRAELQAAQLPFAECNGGLPGFIELMDQSPIAEPNGGVEIDTGAGLASTN